MNDLFLELFFPTDSLHNAGFYGRDEVEDPLDEALQTSELGEVTGGGGGELGSNVDIEIWDEANFDVALNVIRRTLVEIKAPETTIIIRHQPVRQEFRINE